MRSQPSPPRSRTRGQRTATGPMLVMNSRSGRCPWRTNRRRPSSVSLSAWQLSKLETSASTACARSARAPLRKISVSGSVKVPGCESRKTLVSVTAYHSFAGEVGASNTSTIRRLTLSRRHQLSPIAPCADDRPSDPLGNYTVELNKEAYLFGIWEFLRDQVLLDRARFHLCIESNNEPNNTDCASVSTLMKIVEEARQNQGKAVQGHLNRSINLMIKAAPGDWTGPLEAITMRNGDCKSYSIAKYAAARAAGFSADHVRLVTVHDRQYHF